MAEAPGRLETGAAAFAGVAFATGALLVRKGTLLPAGFFDGAAMVALGFGLSPFAHRALGAWSAPLARAIALAIAALLIGAALLPPFDRAGIPLAAWTLGAGALQAATRTKRASLALAAGGILLLALGVGVAWGGAGLWPESARLRGAIGAGAVLATIGLVGRVLVARRSPDLAPSPVGVLLVAALAASYLAYRPLVATRVANLPLYEWTLGVGAGVLMLARLRRSARDTAVNEAWSGAARKHRQDAAPAYDPRMAPLAAPIQRYLETGEGFEEYRAAMARLLNASADASGSSASPAVTPLAPPHFRKTLQGARPVQGRGRAAKGARRERLATHEALMELIHGHPEPAMRAHP